jgi:hypothetical protein
MSLILKIGPDTRSRLGRAAFRRFLEADCLIEAKHHLTAIYLFGYVAEMVIGAAYCKNLRYGVNDPIDPSRLNTMLKAARQLSKAVDKSHPIDGLARLLVNDKGALAPPAYDKKLGLRIIDRADLIGRHWSPKLRYRAIDASWEVVSEVREAAEWFLKNSERL